MFHVTVPRTSMVACDAVVREIQTLRDFVGGPEIQHLYPGTRPGTRIPRHWWGVSRLPLIRRLENEVDLHHLFNPDPFPFFLLRFLRKPIVYTAVAGLGRASQQMVSRLAGRVRLLLLPTEVDQQQAMRWGITNVRTIGPIFDGRRFHYQSPPPEQPLTLLMASAPWTMSQFQSKGVDALLTAAQQEPQLHLIFLWRGILFAEMQRRVQRAGLEDRVRVINDQVDVNQVLAGIHATVLLVSDPALIKAHPHSLLESLAAGKPIVVSEKLPLAQLVADTGCGVVIEEVNASAVRQALRALRRDYAVYRQAAQPTFQRYFPSSLAAHQLLYAEVLQNES